MITGASGFIGAHLTRLFLESGSTVFVLKRGKTPSWRLQDIMDDIQQENIDLRDASAVEKSLRCIKPDIICHAAIYGGYPSQQQENEMFETNCLGTVNLVNACVRDGLELFIHAGTSSEYGIKNQPMSEDHVCRPHTPYGVTKAFATTYCQMKALTEGLPITTLRLFSPFGPYEVETRLVPTLILSCLQDKDPRLSSPANVRDFIYIEDVLDAFKKVILHKDRCAGQIINIGQGCQHTVGDVARLVQRLTRTRAQLRWGEMENPRREVPVWQADIRKAKELLDWQPAHDLEQGLTKTIAWFRDHLTLYESANAASL